MESAVASPRLNGENGWQRMWFDGVGHRWVRMHDTLGFNCGAYMGSQDRAGPRAGEGVGKTNHISFQNFHYEAAVDPSEHTGNACPCDREERRGNEKKNRPRLCLAEKRGRNRKGPSAAPPLHHEYHEYITPMELDTSQRPPGSRLAKRNGKNPQMRREVG